MIDTIYPSNDQIRIVKTKRGSCFGKSQHKNQRHELITLKVTCLVKRLKMSLRGIEKKEIIKFQI